MMERRRTEQETLREKGGYAVAGIMNEMIVNLYISYQYNDT